MKLPDAWRTSVLHKIGSAWLYLSYLTLLASSVTWFNNPSASVDKVLGTQWSGAWTLSYGLFALVALIARFVGGSLTRRHLDNSRAYQVEGVACVIAACAVWIWGVIVVAVSIIDGTGNGMQIGIALGGYSAHLIGWGLIEISWVNRTASERDAILHDISARLAERVADRE